MGQTRALLLVVSTPRSYNHCKCVDTPTLAVAQALPIATLTLLTPGVCTLLVDQGRPRSRSLGVPVGGAADGAAFALGNALLGNPRDAPALEICLAGPTLQADEDLACVLFGAPFTLSLGHQSLTAGKTFTLPAGAPLAVGGTPSGMRAYFCVRGGLTGTVILDSQSSLEPLPPGEALPCSPGRTIARFLVHPFAWNARPRRLRVLPAPQASWFPPDALYSGRSFQVTPASNRMGLRLHDEPLPVPARELVSEPVCPGTVQVTRDGQCIVLGVDGQTIGGYPKIAQVIAADIDKLGQLRPGEQVEFERVSLEEADAIRRGKHAELNAWLTRLRAAAG